MNILVLLKIVSQAQFADTLEDRGGRLDAGQLVVNPADLYALELALRVKDAAPGTAVTVLTMAPPSCQQELRQALGMGADRAVLLADRRLAGSDTLATAKALAAAIRTLPAQDLILCGRKAIDSETGHIGPQLSQLLGYTAATNVVDFTLSDENIRIHCLRDRALSEYEGSLPALLTVCTGTNMVRKPTILGLRRSKRAEVLQLSLEDLDLPTAEAGIGGSLTRVAGVASAEFRRGRGERTDDPECGISRLAEALEEWGHGHA